MQWVASTFHTTSEHGVSSITTADTHTSGCQQSTELTPPHADLNGLVRFAERRNLVSALVLSHFKRSLLHKHIGRVDKTVRNGSLQLGYRWLWQVLRNVEKSSWAVRYSFCSRLVYKLCDVTPVKRKGPSGEPDSRSVK